jgi:hypothetical protein
MGPGEESIEKSKTGLSGIKDTLGEIANPVGKTVRCDGIYGYLMAKKSQ